MHDTFRRDLLGRLGGPNSVTVPGFLLGLGFTLVLGAAGAAATGAGPIWVVPAVVGHCSAFAVLAVARRTVLRHAGRRPRPLRTALCFAAAALVGGNLAGGVARAVTGGGTSDVEPPPPGPIAVVAVLATVIAFTLVSSFTAIVVDAWRQHRAWSAERRTWLDRLDYLRWQASDDLARQRHEHHRTVADALRELVEAAPTAPVADLATMLRATAASIVRPLSHRLATTPVPEVATTPPSPATLGDLLRSLTGQPLVQPVALTVLASVPGGLFALLERPTSGTLFVVGGAVTTLLTSSALLDAVVDRPSPGRFRLGVWSTGIVTLALAPLIAAAAFDDRYPAASVTGFSILVFGVLQPVWRTGRQAFDAGERERAALLRAVERETMDVRQREWIEQDRLAKALHGRVQSTLLASALRLSEAHDEGDGDRRTLEQTLAVLSDELLGEPTHRSLVDTVIDLQAVWSGLCHIDADLEALAGLDITAPTSIVLQRAMTEITTNAIVHGHASRVAIRVVRTGSEAVTVDIDADGTFDEAGRPGLGSAMLDELATSWSVTATGSGVTSRVVVPVGSDRSDAPLPPRSAGSPRPAG